MNRKELEELGLTKEQIDRVLDDFHAKVEDYKTETKTKDATIKTLQEDLKTKESDIASLSKSGATAEEIRAELDALKVKYDEDSKNNAEKLQKITFDSDIDKAILKSGAKNSKLVRMLLLEKESELKQSNNRTSDIDEMLKALKESEDTSLLFGEVETKPVDTINTVGAITGTKPTQIGGVEAAFMARNPDLKL